MEELIIDAENHVLGRMASRIAKELLKGKKVIVINAEKAVVSGNPGYNIQVFREKISRGDPYHGPFYPRRPDDIVKRVVKGMLPKKSRGREALKRLKVYVSIPEGLSGTPKKIEEAENKLKCKYITLEKISESLGVKKTW